MASPVYAACGAERLVTMSCNRLRNKDLPSIRGAKNEAINWRLPHLIRFMLIKRKVKFGHLITDHFSLLIKVWWKCVAFWTQKFEEHIKFQYSRHQSSGTLRDQGSRGKKCRNFFCDVGTGPLRCEMAGEGNGSTAVSKTPTDSTGLLHAISRFRGQFSNSQSKNPHSR